jgi:nucleoid-associated protein EbfC
MRGFGGGGMGNMGNMAGLLKQAQKAMQQAEEVQRQLEAESVDGSAGGGMVTCQANGLGKISAITIDPQVVDPEDVEMLQDLVLTAVSEALEKSEQLRQQRQQALMGSMGLPPGMF